MTGDEAKIVVARVRAWDRADREALAALPAREAALIGDAVLLLDARPCDPVTAADGVVEVDLR